jgi:hypothetical protein
MEMKYGTKWSQWRIKDSVWMGSIPLLDDNLPVAGEIKEGEPRPSCATTVIYIRNVTAIPERYSTIKMPRNQ